MRDLPRVTRRPAPAKRFRRSQALVVFWLRGRLAYFDCISGNRRTLPASVLPVLAALGDWTTPAEFRREHPELGPIREVSRLLESLHGHGLIERDDSSSVNWPWAAWMPEAAFFHFGTRDATYPADMLSHELGLREKAKTQPQPPPTKSSRGKRLFLSQPSGTGALGDNLRERRTWRSFSGQSISLGDLATLLGLTWGVQRRGSVEGQGEVVFKTSPSGGARHPIEAYVVARSVSGLPAAVYHYDSAAHALVRVGAAIQPKRLVHLLANQYYFGNCAAAIVMTACVGRTMWRYPYARAYRSVLIEAGHLGQTFCLLATHLGLAPFTTIAFQDSELEAALALEGSAESAMYVVGVGTRLAAAADRPGRIPGRN